MEPEWLVVSAAIMVMVIPSRRSKGSVRWPKE
jgi:hypothetical protein